MKKIVSILLFSLINIYAIAGWNPVLTSFQDDFTSITWKGNINLVTGHKGAYYSTNNGFLSTDWQRAENYFNNSDSTLYNNSQFYGCYPDFNLNQIYICGQDTIQNKAVIFTFNTISFELKSMFVGPINSKLNKMERETSLNRLYAVGDNGYVITFVNSPVLTITTIPTGITSDLKSLVIYGSKMTMASGDNVVWGTISGSGTTVSFGVENFPGRNFKDIHGTTGTMYCTGYQYGSLNIANYNLAEPHLYHADSLNGKSIYRTNSNIFIGGALGIYRGSTTNDVFEFQPSSSGFIAADFVTKSNVVYSCGEDGKIYYTTDTGGVPEPFAKINTSGGCVNTSYLISATKGTIANCTWYLDNNYIGGSNCASFYYPFNSIGTFQLKMIYSNSAGTDSAIVNMNIESPPLNNLPTSISDSVLCHDESTVITINSSQIGVNYSLIRIHDNMNFGGSATSLGGIISFTTNPINLTSKFFIRATNSTSGCSKLFTDTIYIQVQHTKADFHSGLINAEIGEVVNFFEQTAEATNFKWTFSNSPNVTISYAANPTNSFSSLGNNTVKLVAWSNEGCYDSISKEGAYIYDNSLFNDSCWNMFIDGFDQNLLISNSSITSSKKFQDGYVLSGDFQWATLKSNLGVPKYLPNRGSYVAKYSNNGVLKWIYHTKQVIGSFSTLDLDQIRIMNIDASNNIYITGFVRESYLIDNLGDTIDHLKNLGYQNYIAKLSPEGKVLWTRSTISYQPFSDIKSDNQSNLYVTLHGIDYNLPTIGNVNTLHLFKNGQLLDTITDAVKVCNNCDIIYILKIDSNGDLLTDFLIETSTNVNSTDYSPRLFIDNADNLYLYGNVSEKIIFHEPYSIDTTQIAYPYTFYQSKMYVVKYNSAGDILWKTKSHMDDTQFGHTVIKDLVVDNQSNCYFVGENGYDLLNLERKQLFFNGNGTINNMRAGQYMVGKLNSNGNLQWINGNIHSSKMNSTSLNSYGNFILLESNEIKVIGFTYSLLASDYHTYFTSQDGKVIDYTTKGGEYFINRYDFNGNIISCIKSGNNPHYCEWSKFGFRQFNKLSDGSYLSVSNINTDNLVPITNYPLTEFGSEIPLNIEFSGIVTKYNLDCGFELYPNNLQIEYDTVCFGDSYIYPDNTIKSNVYYADQHVSILNSSNLSDSLILTIVTPTQFVSATISQNLNWLFTLDTGLTYQWINCLTGNTPIPGATNSQYSVTQTGSYALIINGNSCPDTSDCISVNYTSPVEITELHNAFSIHPNPTDSDVNLNLLNPDANWKVVVKGSDGRLISEYNHISGTEQKISLPTENGVYFVIIQLSTGEFYNEKIIKR